MLTCAPVASEHRVHGAGALRLERISAPTWAARRSAIRLRQIRQASEGITELDLGKGTAPYLLPRVIYKPQCNSESGTRVRRIQGCHINQLRPTSAPANL
jgi:hypothetical protein